MNTSSSKQQENFPRLNVWSQNRNTSHQFSQKVWSQNKNTSHKFSQKGWSQNTNTSHQFSQDNPFHNTNLTSDFIKFNNINKKNWEEYDRHILLMSQHPSITEAQQKSQDQIRIFKELSENINFNNAIFL